MRCTTLVGLLAGLVVVGLISSAPAADEKKSDFFNGTNLDGWEGLIADFWTVKDGAIIGTAGDKKVPFNTFLWSKKKYKDFELKFQVRLKGGDGNSGVQIRSKIKDPKEFSAEGPQCDIGQEYWASLYGENFGGMMKKAPPEVVKKALKPADFNDYYIKAVGKHVIIKLNGETTVDDDFPKMPDDGQIGWQLHEGHVMEVTFRNIEFKELESK